MTNGATELGAEEIKHFEDLARQFATRSILPIFQGEFSDGDLSQVDDLVDTAFDIGIAGSADRSISGSEYGIWGSAVDETGLLPSMVLLSAVAETCGGIAMALHAQGVASNLLLHAGYQAKPAPKRVAFCLQEGFTLPYLGTLLHPASDEPARIDTEASAESDGYIIKGEKSFIYSLSDPQAYVVLARTDDKWGCYVVPSDAQGMETFDPGRRAGLRACELKHIRFHGVRVPSQARVGAEDAQPLVYRALCLHWIGMSAIAAGIARGALAAAKVYCSERYQGGTIIENHPAVKSLIAGAEARAAAAAAAVTRLSGCDLNRLETVGQAAQLKLAAMELCTQAVTDSLQTFGGYGYMEDYGMEKRLRDMAVLKSASGSPIYLRQLVADIDRKGRA
jgi:alkylation response protein AidB-like acyl-CoA dehydrogenase